MSDCDGTLLNDNSEIDEESILAVERFQKAGGIFMLATGRNRWDAAYVTDKIRNCVLNCDDGAVLFDEDGYPHIFELKDSLDKWYEKDNKKYLLCEAFGKG